jgi:hypothetical protein
MGNNNFTCSQPYLSVRQQLLAGQIEAKTGQAEKIIHTLFTNRVEIPSCNADSESP